MNATIDIKIQRGQVTGNLSFNPQRVTNTPECNLVKKAFDRVIEDLQDLQSNPNAATPIPIEEPVAEVKETTPLTEPAPFRPYTPPALTMNAPGPQQGSDPLALSMSQPPVPKTEKKAEGEPQKQSDLGTKHTGGITSGAGSNAARERLADIAKQKEALLAASIAETKPSEPATSETKTADDKSAESNDSGATQEEGK